MAKKMLVDLGRCVGCWTCSMACKVFHDLPDEDYRITVRTNGSGAGIDRAAGVYPDLRMSWQPVYKTSCTWCVERQAEGLGPMCAYSCPTEALAYGDADDPASDFSLALKRVQERKYHIFEIPEYEGTRKGVVYAKRN